MLASGNHQTQQETLPVAMTAAAARELLARSPYRPLQRLACEVQHGVLHLRGRVPTFYLKQIALVTVRELAGSYRVVNEIEVGP